MSEHTVGEFDIRVECLARLGVGISHVCPACAMKVSQPVGSRLEIAHVR